MRVKLFNSNHMKDLSQKFKMGCVLVSVLTSSVAFSQSQIEGAYQKGDLVKAVDENNFEKINQVVKQMKGTDIDQEITPNFNPILVAMAMRDRDDIIKILLENGANINIENRAMSTPVMWAARFGQVASLQLLIDKKADLNKKNWSKNEVEMTALMLAVKYGQLEAVKLLLDAGAKKDLKNGDGETVQKILAKKLLELYQASTLENKIFLPENNLDAENLNNLINEMKIHSSKMKNRKETSRYLQIYALLNPEIKVEDKESTSNCKKIPETVNVEISNLVGLSLMDEIKNAQKKKLKSATERELAPRPKAVKNLESYLLEGLKAKRKDIQSEDSSDSDSESDAEIGSPKAVQAANLLAPKPQSLEKDVMDSSIILLPDNNSTDTSLTPTIKNNPLEMKKIIPAKNPQSTRNLLLDIQNTASKLKLKKVDQTSTKKSNLDVDKSIGGILFKKFTQMDYGKGSAVKSSGNKNKMNSDNGKSFDDEWDD